VTTVLVAETMVLVVLAVLVVGLLRSHADILRRLHELDGGDAAARAATTAEPAAFAVHEAIPGPRAGDGAFPAAADIAGTGLVDDLVTISVAGSRTPVLLAFLSSSCMTCRPFWDAFATPDRLGLPPGTRAAVVARDAGEESMSRLAELARGVETVVLSGQAWQDYAVPGSPYFVWVVGGQVRGEGTGISWDQVRTLLSDASLSSARRGAHASMEARIDAELDAAGIGPGDPSLGPSVESAPRT
jgi:hypothetical protein